LNIWKTVVGISISMQMLLLTVKDHPRYLQQCSHGVSKCSANVSFYFRTIYEIAILCAAFKVS